MKQLLRIFFVLALLCSGSSLAKADGVDFRMTVLDPPNVCTPDDTACFFYNSGPLSNVALSQAACAAVGIGSGLESGTYGCFVLDNLSGSTIDSLTLSFLGAPLDNQDASCDADGQSGRSSALNVVSCSSPTDTSSLVSLAATETCTPVSTTGPGSSDCYQLQFAGGAGVPAGNNLIVFEQGADPSLFEGGAGIVGVTPEPDSLLLFSTGVMMAGLYMSRRMWMTVRKSADGNR